MDLLFELIRTNFKLRYNNSLLGIIWVLLRPFLTFLVLYVVFSSFRGNEAINNYAIYLLSGIILFTFINEGIVFGLNSLLDKSNIILKVNFNRSIAVLSSVLMAVINLAINLLILVVFIIFNPVSTNLQGVLFFLFNIVTMGFIVMGVSYFSSIILIKFRDLRNITDLSMQLLFYGSAIFYPITLIPEKFRVLVELNPLYILIYSARMALTNGEIVLSKQVFLVFSGSVLILVFGMVFFNKYIKKVAEYF